MVVTLGQQYDNRGETHRYYAVHYINRHAGTPDDQNIFST